MTGPPQGEINHQGFLWKLFANDRDRLGHTVKNHILLLDLVDPLALQEFIHSPDSVPLLTLVVLVENLFATLLVFSVSLSFVKKLVFWNRNSLSSLHLMKIHASLSVMSDELSM